MSSFSNNQLLQFLGNEDPIVRFVAVEEIRDRPGSHSSLRSSILSMTDNMNDPNQREAACEALGYVGGASAVSVLIGRLSDPDVWVKSKAAWALRGVSWEAQDSLSEMLDALIANSAPAGTIDADDPLQFSNGFLVETIFTTDPFPDELRNVPQAKLYEAIRAGLGLPTGYARSKLANFIREELSLADVQALAPELVDVVSMRSPADRMFSEIIRYAGLDALAKFRVDEGIPLALLLQEQTWDSTAEEEGWRPLNHLINSYGGAAKEILPVIKTWKNHVPKFDSIPGFQSEHAEFMDSNFDAAIAFFESVSSSPSLNHFKSVEISSTFRISTNQMQLTAAAIDLDEGDSRYLWDVVSGPGQVHFSSNGTTKSATTIATFSLPGTYQIRVGVADSDILNGGVWISSSSQAGDATTDFKTYEGNYGATYSESEALALSAGSNWPPHANPLIVEAKPDDLKLVTLDATDFNGDALSYSITTMPVHGTITGNFPYLLYQPNPGFFGSDSFVYRVTDPSGASSSATVSITVRNTLDVFVNFESMEQSVSPSSLSGPSGGLGETWNQLFVDEGANLKDRHGVTSSVGCYSIRWDGEWEYSQGRAAELGTPALSILSAGLRNFDGSPENRFRFVINGLEKGKRYNVWIPSAATQSLTQSTNERGKGVWNCLNVTSSPTSQNIDNQNSVNGSTWVEGNNFVLYENTEANTYGEIIFTGTSPVEGPTFENRLIINGFQIREVLPSSAYSTWAANSSQGLTSEVNDGMLDDPDQDGMSNFLEFVIGGDPMAPSTGLLPVVSNPGNGGNWTFEYNRSRVSAPPHSTQIVEYGSDLKGWTQIVIPEGSFGQVNVSSGGTFDRIRVSIPGLGESGFVRLRVSN